MRTGFFISLLLFGILAGCSSFPTTPHPVEKKLKDFLDFSENTEVFLIAGSNDTANFAEEVLAQRRLWIERGIRPAQIACYYAPPFNVVTNPDSAQFAEIEKKISSCYLADYRIIERHLKKVASAKTAPYFYLYFTGHGEPPLKVKREVFPKLFGDTIAQERLKNAENFAFWRPEDDVYTLKLNAVQGKGPISDGGIFSARGTRVTAHEIGLTPHNLAYLLAQLPKKTQKTLVLQGCFSGGFLSPIPGLGNRTIGQVVPNLTILTASSDMRASFGCDPGDTMTDYGTIFLQRLRETKGKPPEIDWQKIAADVISKVRIRERKIGYRQEFYSEPQFMTNSPQ